MSAVKNSLKLCDGFPCRTLTSNYTITSNRASFSLRRRTLYSTALSGARSGGSNNAETHRELSESVIALIMRVKTRKFKLCGGTDKG